MLGPLAAHIRRPDLIEFPHVLSLALRWWCGEIVNATPNARLRRFRHQQVGAVDAGLRIRRHPGHSANLAVTALLPNFLTEAMAVN